MTISAARVKELRERTGAGMMECKKALVETGGDIEAAVELMRKTGQAKADHKAGRVAAEGLVATAVRGRRGSLVEVNCETDFVARERDFAAFVDALARLALEHQAADAEELLGLTLDRQSVEQARRALIARLGENINVRRAAVLAASDALGVYVHTNSKIGTLVALRGGNEVLARDLAMHIAWSNPAYLSVDDVPAEWLAGQREILAEQARGERKPPQIVEKMVEGRLRKQLDEMTLLGQPFVKDPETSVGELLESARTTVEGYLRFEVGEGVPDLTNGPSPVASGGGVR